MDGQAKFQENEPSVLDVQMKEEVRVKLVQESMLLIGIPYEFKAEWTDFAQLPKKLDCSEMLEGLYARVARELNIVKLLPMPDGSHNQYNYTQPIAEENAQPGDLCFFGHDANATKIYHVGMVFDLKNIIEARGFDPKATFETGKVILRPRERWEHYTNWRGYRRHPALV